MNKCTICDRVNCRALTPRNWSPFDIREDGTIASATPWLYACDGVAVDWRKRALAAEEKLAAIANKKLEKDNG